MVRDAKESAGRAFIGEIASLKAGNGQVLIFV